LYTPAREKGIGIDEKNIGSLAHESIEGCINLAHACPIEFYQRNGSRLKSRGVKHSDLQIVGAQNIDPSKHALCCDVSIAMFREIAMPPQQEGASLPPMQPCWCRFGCNLYSHFILQKTALPYRRSPFSEARSISFNQLGCPTSRSLLRRGAGRQRLSHV
jgi:hypothetical protein